MGNEYLEHIYDNGYINSLYLRVKHQIKNNNIDILLNMNKKMNPNVEKIINNKLTLYLKEKAKKKQYYIDKIRSYTIEIDFIVFSEKSDKNRKIIHKIIKKYWKYYNKLVFTKKNINDIEKYMDVCIYSKPEKTSKGEDMIDKIFNNLISEKTLKYYVREKVFDGLVNKKNLRFDFYSYLETDDKYIPFIIEYDGKQHWSKMYNVSQKETNENDHIKELYAKENNISMLRISWKTKDKKDARTLIENFINDLREKEYVYMVDDEELYSKRII